MSNFPFSLGAIVFHLGLGGMFEPRCLHWFLLSVSYVRSEIISASMCELVV